MYRLITLNVNGDERTIALKPNTTLLDVIRDKLDLTGTKKGCGLGVCGACTVLVDGEPMSSCLLLAANMEGKRIKTIEGLEKNGKLSPVQKSFVHSGAIQCGYCTPGMVMSAEALIDKSPEPTEDDIKEALGGNLCRCTGYVKIIDAVKNWKKYGNLDGPELKEYDTDDYKIVGKNNRRLRMI